RLPYRELASPRDSVSERAASCALADDIPLARVERGRFLERLLSLPQLPELLENRGLHDERVRDLPERVRPPQELDRCLGGRVGGFALLPARQYERLGRPPERLRLDVVVARDLLRHGSECRRFVALPLATEQQGEVCRNGRSQVVLAHSLQRVVVPSEL